jgi:7,8-dihydroneopterin aldolase/epimerase/oxygenase
MATPEKIATLRLMNMTFYGYHGASAAEKETGRRFEVDCEYTLDISKAAQSDLLEDTVSYADVYKVIEDVLNNSRYNLMETLIERMADAIFNSFRIRSLRLRIRKMIPPVPGNIDYLEIETVREM